MDQIDRSLVYTAQSKQYFYCRDVVCEYVFRRGAVPLNPFRAFDYFLNDRVARDLVRKGNQRLIAACDEMWVFGDRLADGVLVEIAQAARLNMPVRFFTIGNSLSDITEIQANRLSFESEVEDSVGLSAVQMLDHVLKGQTESIVLALGRVHEVRDRI
jgi:hypothetical protein